MGNAPGWIVLLMVLALVLSPMLGFLVTLGLEGLEVGALAGKLGATVAVVLLGLCNSLCALLLWRRRLPDWYSDRVLVTAATLALLSPPGLALIWS